MCGKPDLTSEVRLFIDIKPDFKFFLVEHSFPEKYINFIVKKVRK